MLLKFACLPGRLADPSLISRSGPNACLFSHQGPPTPGLDYQLRLIRAPAQPNFRFYWHAIRHKHHTMALLNPLDHWRSRPWVTALDLHRLLGILNFMATLVPRGRMPLRPVQWWAKEVWCQEEGLWSHVALITPSILHKLAWWASPVVFWGIWLSTREAELTLYTDASCHGWGAQLGECYLQGSWSDAQCCNHINVLELEAVFCGVRGFCPFLRHIEVRLMCDNSTAVVYIRQEGRT